jgi:hypothetical protein
VYGTIPDSLAALRELRRLELGTNFLSGTMGRWLSDLIHLEVLGLGANSGDNPPDPRTGEVVTGLTGTIPAGFSKLTKLVELNLQVRGGARAAAAAADVPQDGGYGGPPKPRAPT